MNCGNSIKVIDRQLHKYLTHRKSQLIFLAVRWNHAKKWCIPLYYKGNKIFRNKLSTIGIECPLFDSVVSNNGKSFLVLRKKTCEITKFNDLFVDLDLPNGEYLIERIHGIGWHHIKRIQSVIVTLNPKLIKHTTNISEYMNNIWTALCAIYINKLEAAETDVLAGATYKIRTPLNIVMHSISELLHKKEITKYSRLLSHIRSGTNDLLSTIADLTDLSRILSGNIEDFGEMFNFKELIHKITEITKYANGGDRLNIKVNNYSPHAPSWVYGDTTKIQQIILNILTNAIKHTPNLKTMNRNIPIIEINTICIPATKVEREWASKNYFDKMNNKDLAKYKNSSAISITMTFKDNGVGMSKEDIDKIFKFAYLTSSFNVYTDLNYSDDEKISINASKSTTAASKTGSGLGMYITSYLAERIGGSLWIQSTEPGKGTTMALSFILLEIPPTNLLKASMHILNKKTVAIIDKNPKVRDTISKLMRKWNMIPKSYASLSDIKVQP